MAQRAGLMAFEDFGFLVLAFAAADGSQKVGKVVFVFAFEGADQVAVEIEQRAAGDDAFGAFENRAALEAKRRSFQAARLGNNRLVAEIENTNLRVGRLARVAVAEAAAVADDRAPEASDAQTPAAD